MRFEQGRPNPNPMSKKLHRFATKIAVRDSFALEQCWRKQVKPVLAVKRSLFVEIQFLRTIFFETPCKILALGF